MYVLCTLFFIMYLCPPAVASDPIIGEVFVCLLCLAHESVWNGFWQCVLGSHQLWASHTPFELRIVATTGHTWCLCVPYGNELLWLPLQHLAIKM